VASDPDAPNLIATDGQSLYQAGGYLEARSLSFASDWNEPATVVTGFILAGSTIVTMNNDQYPGWISGGRVLSGVEIEMAHSSGWSRTTNRPPGRAATGRTRRGET
jgi:hypothetical protein